MKVGIIGIDVMGEPMARNVRNEAVGAPDVEAPVSGSRQPVETANHSLFAEAMAAALAQDDAIGIIKILRKGR